MLIFVTGASGLIGFGVVARLLQAHPTLRVAVLVRDPRRWATVALALGPDRDRVIVTTGDLRVPGLGLDAATRERLARTVTAVIHAAADTRFSQTRADAESTNVAGTRHVLDVVGDWREVRSLTQTSTAFVAGTRTGTIDEMPSEATHWVNAYEWSKHECESLVRRAQVPWVIVRPSTIVCDDRGGAVSQVNAIHRSLRLYHHGLAPMIPGDAASSLDVVTTDHVATAIARIALREDVIGRTLHLCAGAGAMPLGELLDTTCEHWAASAAWRRRGVTRPAITDLATYRLFERTVEEAGDERLKQVTRSLSHFVPQLAYPKCFSTALAESLTGMEAPPVRTYWRAMLEQLEAARWGASRRAAA